MLIETSIQEVHKRENAFKQIKKILNTKGRENIYDLTGLSGGFLATTQDLELLETYIGPATFEEQLQKQGKKHLGGEKIFAVNRTSSGILATIIALVPENGKVQHFLKEKPGHPSIPRSCKLLNAEYTEHTNINQFKIQENTNLLIITGSNMDHETIDENTFKKLIQKAKEQNIPVLVDDASGARIRTAIYKQKKATELGADLVVTSTDKLMKGPRGGLMAGKKELIDKIKSKATQFGLEAQPPSILAILKGLEEYNPENLKKSLNKKTQLIQTLNKEYTCFKETPTGIMVKQEDLAETLNCKNPDLAPKDLNFLWAMILLKQEGIITIPSVGMPSASPTIRFDLAAPDSQKLTNTELTEKIKSTLKTVKKLMNNTEEVKKTILE